MVNLDFGLAYDSSEGSTTNCNEVILFFSINPIHDSYYKANFSKLYATNNESRLEYQNDAFIYSKGMIGYSFKYKSEIVGSTVEFLFTPKFSGIPEIAYVPLYRIILTITPSISSVPLNYQSIEMCLKKDAVSTYVESIEIASYTILILSALPAKIVGI